MQQPSKWPFDKNHDGQCYDNCHQDETESKQEAGRESKLDSKWGGIRAEEKLDNHNLNHTADN